MATITTKAAEAVGFWGYPNITIPRETEREASSSTFLKGSFVISSSGLIAVIASDNDGDAVGIATKAGQNLTASATLRTEYVPMVPGLKVEMNLLEASDAVHVLAQADLWTGCQWQTQATTLERTLDTTSTTDRFVVVKVGLGAVGDAYGRGGVGDTNARVFAVPTGSMCLTSPDV